MLPVQLLCFCHVDVLCYLCSCYVSVMLFCCCCCLLCLLLLLCTCLVVASAVAKFLSCSDLVVAGVVATTVAVNIAVGVIVAAVAVWPHLQPLLSKCLSFFFCFPFTTSLPYLASVEENGLREVATLLSGRRAADQSGDQAPEGAGKQGALTKKKLQ